MAGFGVAGQEVFPDERGDRNAEVIGEPCDEGHRRIVRPTFLEFPDMRLGDSNRVGDLGAAYEFPSPHQAVRIFGSSSLRRMPPPMRLSRDLLIRGITYKLQERANPRKCCRFSHTGK